MISTIIRAVRLISILAGIIGSVMEVRNFYLKRKHVWDILRRLVRQTG